MKFSKMLIEVEVGGDNSVITDLQNQGFMVEPNDEGSNQYTVSKNGQTALLDLSTEDSMTDSLKTIRAAFDTETEVDTDVYSGQNYPIMSQKSSDHKLAQRVAAIGEADNRNKIKLPVQATSAAGGKTYHHDVYLIHPDVATKQMQMMVGKSPEPIVQIDKTPGSWYASDFMKGSGPLAIDFGSGWVLVNADEIRDAVAEYQTNDWEASGKPDELWKKIQAKLNDLKSKRDDEQSFSESNKGLWHNIHQKRKRMGKNYRPAKPGEKGRPESKAWKNAQK
jgi:hypothetical protein